ncbi:MAG: hypothetical protein ACTSPB_11185 [Candidatus Thorarchaeota archaeon]
MSIESQVTTPDISKVMQYVLICDPDGNEIDSHHGHLKTFGLHESIGHSDTNTDITVERAKGRKTGIGIGAYTLLEEAAFVQPAGDTQMYIQSTSAEDAAGGSGAEQLTLEYFSLAWGDMKTVQVVPDGTNQVTISVSDIYRLHDVYINKGHNAVGLITLTNQAASVLYGQISIYHAFMQRCIFYVGNGKKVTCTEGIIGTYSKEGIIGRLFASEEDGDGNIVPRARIVFELAGDTFPYPFEISETVSNPNNKRIAIGLAITGIAADQNATGTIKGYGDSI